MSSMVEISNNYVMTSLSGLRVSRQGRYSYDKPALAELIMKYYPDWRRVLNELQRYSLSGKIDIGILNNISDKNYNDLFSSIKSKNFKKMRSWVVNNIDTDASAIFRSIYDRMQDHVKPQSIPQLVLI